MTIQGHAHHAARRFALPRIFVVATDLMDQELLVPYVVSEAKRTSAHVVLVHATPYSADPMGLVFSPGLGDVYLDSLSALEAMQRSIQRQGISCSIRISHKTPVDAVQHAIDDVHADRLIAGSRGRRNVKEWLLGSTARAFMSSLTIPMMFVGPNCRPASDGSIRNILCLISLQKDYEELAHFAFYLAEVHDARVVLLHVLEATREQDTNPARTEQWTRTALHGLIDSYGRRKDRASVLVERGDVATETLSAVEDSAADLIITGTREPEHRSPLRDGIAYQLVASAKVPVICYRVNPGGLHAPMSAAHERAALRS